MALIGTALAGLGAVISAFVFVLMLMESWCNFWWCAAPAPTAAPQKGDGTNKANKKAQFYYAARKIQCQISNNNNNRVIIREPVQSTHLNTNNTAVYMVPKLYCPAKIRNNSNNNNNMAIRTNSSTYSAVVSTNCNCPNTGNKNAVLLQPVVFQTMELYHHPLVTAISAPQLDDGFWPPINKPGRNLRQNVRKRTEVDNKENCAPNSSNNGRIEGANATTPTLSRRQKKNRRRDSPPPPRTSPFYGDNYNLAAPLPQCVKLNMSQDEFAQCLRQFVLTPEQLVKFGYPVESQHGGAIFTYTAMPTTYLPFLNVRTAPRPANVDNCQRKTCCRCGTGFYVSDTDILTDEKCIYHWGKLYSPYYGSEGAKRYNCCNQLQNESNGCTEYGTHVHMGCVEGVNGPYPDYVRVRRMRTTTQNMAPVYALDCEMGFTVGGFELLRVSIVANDGRTVYDTLVTTSTTIVDYNTRFSGLSAADFNCPRTNKKTLAQVQTDLKSILRPGTILIGHGLNNDMRALKLIHKCVVDTSVVFPHMRGFPFKRALRTLVYRYLRRTMQTDGHDSVEDAAACMDLMFARLHKDFVL